MKKLIIVHHGEPDRQRNRLTTRGRKQTIMLAERLRAECSQAVRVSVITCSHSYPKETAEILLDDAKYHWLCCTPNTPRPTECSNPFYTLDIIRGETAVYGYFASVAVLIGHKGDALYLPIIYGLRHKAYLQGFNISYGQAVVIDCEAMKEHIITPVRE